MTPSSPVHVAMVKAPKTMQPEGVNLDEINKKGTRGMGDGDDFRNYMARKIDLQRKQFGAAVLPPDPRARERQVRFADDKHVLHHVPTTKKPRVKDMSSLLKRLKKRHGGSSKSRNKRRRNDNNQESHCNEGVARIPQQHNAQDTESHSTLGLDRASHVTMKPSPSLKPSSRRNDRPDLFFRGVVVLVNGYTDPDTETIMRLLHKHGGDLEKYETTRVTHIIAQNLSTAKANMYKRQRKAPRPVCRPEWIVDCVNAGRLLPHGDYILKEVQPEATSSVKKFFVQQGNTARESFKDNDNVNLDRKIAATDSMASKSHFASSSTEAEVDDALNIANVTDSRKSGNTNVQELSALSVISDEDPTHDDGNKMSEHVLNTEARTDSSMGADDTMSLLDDETADNDKTSDMHTDPLIDTISAKSAKALLRSEKPKAGVKPDAITVDKVSTFVRPTGISFADGRTRTVGTDPNFLDSYFNSSRLSFIGSYKQRARQSPTKRASKKTTATCKRFVFLVDMDSFFASVVLRNFPEYRDKPVAISHMGKQGANVDPTHLGSKDSTSECATCNYEARKYGIKKGMFLGRARELCSELVVLPYDFDGYEEVSEHVADILYRVADVRDGTVEQVSCDEAYVEVFLSTDDETTSADELALTIAEGIRKEVFETTQCTATVGVASNKLLAKLATDQVKPNKSMVVRDHRALLEPLKLRDLHGIGYRMERKLTGANLLSVRDVWELGDHAESELIRILGPGLGKKISSFCQGEDDRPIKPAERKTIGAECNYGVRFDGPYGVDFMVEGLAKEVQKRMESVGVKGSRVTLKVKQRKQGAKPPPKFLGHGSCHNLSKSAETAGCLPTKESKVISRIALNLLEQLAVPTDDIRGMGITVSKLVGENATKDLASEPAGRITSWFGQSTTAKSAEQASSRRCLLNTFDHASAGSDGAVDVAQTSADAASSEERPTTTTHATLCQVDDDDVGSPGSPPDIRSEGYSGDSNKATLEEIVDEQDLQPSSIVLSQPEQESLSEEGSSHQHEPIEWQDDDIELPSLSQIHMSQVAELPSPMRKNIVARVSIESNGKRIGASDNEPTKATPGVVRVAKQTKNDGDGTAMRQLSLKRMMKLAAVKSGEDTTLSDSLGGSISLTQLDCLPLEMQLQVANNDELFSRHRTPGSARKKCRRSKARESTSTVHHITSHDRAKDSQEEHNGQPEHREEAPMAQYKAPFLSDQASFYQDNIAPLKVFMDMNPDAEDAALRKVREFLLICVTERRFTDAVTILRSIKNRGDAWSDNAYKEILSAVNELTRSALGMPLDLRGLGL